MLSLKKFSGNTAFIARWVLVFTLGWTALPAARAADTVPPATSAAHDYAKPELLTATLYAVGSDRKTVLYTFRRTATRSGPTVHVLRQFFSTNGTVAASEKILYQSNRLVSFEMQEFQARVSGAAYIEPDPRDPARQKLFIGYTHGLNPPKGDARSLPPDTLIDDTLHPFMLAHWDELMRGDAVPFHFIVLDHERTVAFEFVKTGTSVQNGRPVVELTMKPSSMFLSHLVNPLVFTVEENGAHHILSYRGQTTPRIWKDGSWETLDAETVFHYPLEKTANHTGHTKP